MATKTKTPATPQRFVLDRRASRIAADGIGSGDDLLDTVELCEWLGMSIQWAESARCHGFGPPYIKLGSRTVRYRRDAVLKWLDQRARTGGGTRIRTTQRRRRTVEPDRRIRARA